MQYMTTAERIGIEKGVTQGERVLLLRLLTRRFKNLSASYKKRIEQADAKKLLAWGDRVLEARTLDEVFEEQ